MKKGGKETIARLAEKREGGHCSAPNWEKNAKQKTSPLAASRKRMGEKRGLFESERGEGGFARNKERGDFSA